MGLKAAYFLIILGILSFLKYSLDIRAFETSPYKKNKKLDSYDMKEHELNEVNLRQLKFYRIFGVCEFVIGFILFLFNF